MFKDVDLISRIPKVAPWRMLPRGLTFFHTVDRKIRFSKIPAPVDVALRETTKYNRWETSEIEMKQLSAIALLCATSILAGCAPTQQQFLAMQETVRGSAKARQLAVESCMKDARPGDIKAAAIVTDSSEKSAPRVLCSRLIEALRSGRLTYADAVDLKQGRPTPKLIRIVQGR